MVDGHEKVTSRRSRRKDAARGAVIDVLSDGAWHHGYDMMRAAHVRAGLFYRVLGDLEAAGTVTATWEDDGHTSRRMYRMADGHEKVTEG